jgi:hypothetical protein
MPNGHFAQLLLLALRGRDRSPLQREETGWRSGEFGGAPVPLCRQTLFPVGKPTYMCLKGRPRRQTYQRPISDHLM